MRAYRSRWDSGWSVSALWWPLSIWGVSWPPWTSGMRACTSLSVRGTNAFYASRWRSITTKSSPFPFGLSQSGLAFLSFTKVKGNQLVVILLYREAHTTHLCLAQMETCGCASLVSVEAGGSPGWREATTEPDGFRLGSHLDLGALFWT